MAWAFIALVAAQPAHAQEMREVVPWFKAAQAARGAGIARKTRPVDVRPAKPGEVVVTIIKGEGKETQSKPAAAGDMVVRNRCPATGNEEILVRAETFARRYEGPAGPAAAGWQSYRPRGIEMSYVVVSEGDGTFSFVAPWGERMVARRPGDAIVQDPARPEDTYRIARAAFQCTYEILRQPGR